MNENLFQQLLDKELLNMALKIIDEYMLLNQTANQPATEEKKNELFQVYKLIKERGLIFNTT